MANLHQLNPSFSKRSCRYFSEDFRRKKVEELDKRMISIPEVCREYEVNRSTVYKWIYKYSLMRKKGLKMVVESESDTAKIKALRQRVADLEQLLGQTQFELAFITKQTQIASEKFGIDIKKKLSGKHSSGSGKSGSNTPTK
jgi:transposase